MWLQPLYIEDNKVFNKCFEVDAVEVRKSCDCTDNLEIEDVPMHDILSCIVIKDDYNATTTKMLSCCHSVNELI